jgi:hypothetical protein
MEDPGAGFTNFTHVFNNGNWVPGKNEWFFFGMRWQESPLGYTFFLGWEGDSQLTQLTYDTLSDSATYSEPVSGHAITSWDPYHCELGHAHYSLGSGDSTIPDMQGAADASFDSYVCWGAYRSKPEINTEFTNTKDGASEFDWDWAGPYDYAVGYVFDHAYVTEQFFHDENSDFKGSLEIQARVNFTDVAGSPPSAVYPWFFVADEDQNIVRVAEDSLGRWHEGKPTNGLGDQLLVAAQRFPFNRADAMDGTLYNVIPLWEDVSGLGRLTFFDCGFPGMAWPAIPLLAQVIKPTARVPLAALDAVQFEQLMQHSFRDQEVHFLFRSGGPSSWRSQDANYDTVLDGETIW